VTADEWFRQIRAAGIRPGPPAETSTLARARVALGHVLPPELETLYVAADGFFHEEGQWWVVWPLRRVLEKNPSAWRSGLDASLLAFGDDGTGSPFCMHLAASDGTVVRWNWIDQEVESRYPSLAEFLSEWVRVPTWPPPS